MSRHIAFLCVTIGILVLFVCGCGKDEPAPAAKEDAAATGGQEARESAFDPATFALEEIVVPGNRLLYGYADEKGKWIIPPRFTWAEPFKEGVAVVVMPDGLFGVIDKTGAWVLEPKYVVIKYCDGLFHAILGKDGSRPSSILMALSGSDPNMLTGFVDKSGAFVIRYGEDREIRQAEDFSEGMAPARAENGWGYIDKTGKWTLEPKYMFANPFKHGLAAVRDKQRGGWGIIDRTGTFVIEPTHRNATIVGDGLVFLKKPHRLVNVKTGRVTRIERQDIYDVEEFHEGLAAFTVPREGTTEPMYGYLDPDGKVVIPPKYSGVEPFKDGVACVDFGYAWGFIDRQGNTVVEPQFEVPGAAFVHEDGKWVFKPASRLSSQFSEGLIVAPALPAADAQPAKTPKTEKGPAAAPKPPSPDAVGYIDRKGDWVIPPRFALAALFKDGVAVVSEDGRAWGVIDKKGDWVLRPVYLEASYSEGLVRVKTARGRGFIDLTGRVVVEPGRVFLRARDFKNGFAAAQTRDGKWGYLDKTGKWMVKPQFEKVRDFGPGVGIVKVKEKWGLIDANGRWVVEPTYDAIAPFYEGLAGVEDEDSGCGFIDNTGKFVIPPQPEFAGCEVFRDGAALVDRVRPWFIDRKGKVLFAKSQSEFSLPLNAFPPGFSEGRLPVRYRGEKYGFLDKRGEFVIPPRFKSVQHFHEGLAAVVFDDQDGRKYGFIDRDGKTVIEPRFDYAAGFFDGIGYVKVGKLWGCIDKTGKFIIPARFGRIYRFSEGLAPARPAKEKQVD